MNRATALLALQDVEYSLREALSTYKRVQADRVGSPEVRRARNAYEEANDAERHARAEQADLQLQWQSLIQKLDHEEKRLYDGSIRDARELTNLELEVNMLKRQRGTMETKALELIESVEALAQSTEESRTEYESLDANDKENQQRLADEEQKLKRQISHTRQKRDKLLKEIEPGILEQFRYVQRLKNDTRAVSRLVEGVCTACHVEVSAAKRDIVERTETNTLATCGNCGRILVQ